MQEKHLSNVTFFIYPTDMCQMSWKYVQRLMLCKISTGIILLNATLKTWEILAAALQSVAINSQTHRIDAYVVYW